MTDTSNELAFAAAVAESVAAAAAVLRDDLCAYWRAVVADERRSNDAAVEAVGKFVDALVTLSRSFSDCCRPMMFAAVAAAVKFRLVSCNLRRCSYRTVVVESCNLYAVVVVVAVVAAAVVE